MPWRWIAWTSAALLAVLAALLLVTSLSVSEGGSRAVSCGSAWDALSGREDWASWWSADGVDPAGATGMPVRARECPGAVNSRLWLVGGVLVLSVGSGAAAVVAGRAPSQPRPAGGRLRRLGTVLTVAGAASTVAGVVAVLLVTADPDAPLFNVVDRPSAVLLGLLLVLPAVLLLGLGLVTRAVAGSLDSRDET